jgi:hypothetical protein
MNFIYEDIFWNCNYVSPSPIEKAKTIKQIFLNIITFKNWHRAIKKNKEYADLNLNVSDTCPFMQLKGDIVLNLISDLKEKLSRT